MKEKNTAKANEEETPDLFSTLDKHDSRQKKVTAERKVVLPEPEDNLSNKETTHINSKPLQKNANASSKKSLFLIDANSIIHRAFHALPVSLRNSKGEIVNAVYGFASMLIKLITDYSPYAIIAAFDTKAPTFRHEIFEEYKANRPETADELISQFPKTKEVLQAFDIPIIEIPGFEADDIVATLAKQASEKGFQVYIVSGDRDMLQLVDQNVFVITTKKGISEVKIYKRESVFERFGVYPEEIPDYLALKGEPGDNVPGIPGIGEKTASTLVREFGKLENIYNSIDRLSKKKFYKNLVELKDQAFKARELVTLSTEAPVSIEAISKPFSYDEKKVAEVFSRLEFASLLKRLEIPEKPLEIDFELKRAVSELSEAELLAIASERKECFIHILEGVAVFAVDKGYLKQGTPGIINNLLEPGIQIYTGDLKNLYLWCNDALREKLREKVRRNEIHDFSILLWLKNPDRKKYDIKNYLPEKEVESYLSGVIDWCKQLYSSIADEKMDAVYRDVELALALVLAEMEEKGLPVNIQKLHDLSKELERLLQNTTEEIYRLCGTTFNINSPQQLSYVLYNVLKLKISGRGKTKLSTDQETLIKMIDAHPVIEHILNYREMQKIKRTYVDSFIEKADKSAGRVRGKFIQTGTATGRISSEDPNLQNLPAKGSFSILFSEAIAAPTGRCFVSADYANIDLRVLAHLSEDRLLIDSFARNEDIHLRTAVEVLKISPGQVDEKIRRIAKAINFGIIYGVSAEGLARQAGISVDDAKRYIDSYFEKYSGVKEYMYRTIKKAYENGYVKTILGRRRYLPGLKSSNLSERNAAERYAMNTPVQGSAADIMKVAMLELHKALQDDFKDAFMVLQIHDSLLVECREQDTEQIAATMKHIMERSVQLKVPLLVNIKTGKSLAEV